MKITTRSLVSGALTVLIAVIVFSNLGCQYDYSSPLPGVIEIRLRTISDPSNIEFSPLNSFTIQITSVEAIRANQSRVLIYSDLKAYQVKPNTVNTLDFRARDSSLVIGQTYVPPDDYVGVYLLVEPSRQVILRGYQVITVDRPESFSPLLIFLKPYMVKEGKTTVITLTINLDQSLVKGAFTYEFVPNYEITSIQMF